MAFRFHCTVEKRKMGGNGTVRLLNGLEATHVWEALEGTVYQIGTAGQRFPVGMLQHTVSMTTEDIWTQILYSGGCLTHHWYFDGPVPTVTTYSGAGKEFTLRSIPSGDGRSELECEGVKYPVITETTCGEDHSIQKIVTTVYSQGAGGWELLARITGTGKKENKWEYDIRMECATSALLCIAICSLAI